MKAFFLIIISMWFAGPTQKIYLIGDSTMANKRLVDAPESGWGSWLSRFFNSGVEVINCAVNGRSSKSFRSSGDWDKVYDRLGKDYYVFIQFGHNDSKISDTARYAAADGEFKSNLIRYIQEVRARGAVPVLLTPVVRRRFDDSLTFFDTHGKYPDVTRQVAAEYGVDLIDLHKISQSLVTTLGVQDSKALYLHYLAGTFSKFPAGINDDTHFSPYGAEMIARSVARELFSSNHPLKAFLKRTDITQVYQHDLPIIYQPVFRNDTFCIIKYGAVSGSLNNNTASIQSAIDMAHQAGGGVVVIPQGLWISGPIVLKSRVNLHLEQGALLQFVHDREQYPMILTTWEGQKAYRCQPPISAMGQVHIAITGLGILDGAGQIWKPVKKSKVTESQWKSFILSGGVATADTWYPSMNAKLGYESEWAKKMTPGKSKEDYLTVKDFLRPNMVSMTECKYITIEGVTFRNSPAWTLHPLLCHDLSIKNVHVMNPWYGQNNDAMDIESCSNGIVDGCTLDTGDDAITIKSGRDEEGRARGIPTENFIFKNNTVYHGHGGFVIGSEMSGGVKNLYVSNCTFLGTDIGLRFKTTRGRGGIVSNIFISDIQMSDIAGEAVLFDMYYSAKDPVPLQGEQVIPSVIEYKAKDAGTPVFRDFFIDKISCLGARTAILMNGLPESNIENVRISNSNFSSVEGIKLTEAKQITLDQIALSHQSGPAINLFQTKDLKISFSQLDRIQSPIGILSGKATKNIIFSNSMHRFSMSSFKTGNEVDIRTIQIH